MTDILTPLERSQRMALIRGKDTGPEMLVRRLVHRMGFRYRLHCKSLAGKPDLVFASRKKVIFVHGCFWHWHPESKCKIARMPKSRKEYWEPKLQRTRGRDDQVQSDLMQKGWDCLVIWECQLTDPLSVAQKILAFLQ